jgi:hypothetical protein
MTGLLCAAASTRNRMLQNDAVRSICFEQQAGLCCMSQQPGVALLAASVLLPCRLDLFCCVETESWPPCPGVMLGFACQA